jgi:HEXXH motif-containing protein
LAALIARQRDFNVDLGLHVALGNLQASLGTNSAISVDCAAQALVTMFGDGDRFGAIKSSGVAIWSREELSRLSHLNLGEPIVEDRERAAAAIEAGFSLLEEVWPESVPWLRLVTRHIAVIEGDNRRLVSGSLDHFVGFFYISANDHPLRTAEMLVHEGSHQFFLLAEQAFPVVYDDSALFYSPFARRPRPLSKLMLGFHAFTNICELYQRTSEPNAVMSQMSGGSGAGRTDGSFDEAYKLDNLRALFRSSLPNITPTGQSLISSMLV